MKMTQFDKIKGVAVGKRLAIFLQNRFPDTSESKRHEEFGFSNSTVRSWYEGVRLPDEAFMKLEILGCNLFWLLTGEGNMEENAANALETDANHLFGMNSRGD